MTSLDQARQGRSAARQIRVQAKAGVLTGPELFRLLEKVDAGFAQMMGDDAAQAGGAQAPPESPPRRGPDLTILDGGRS
ncbi:MAG: hypothetical protein U1C74_32755 [Phenylobacterium sp.]|nr:hypothetical protein [Phenylobacterium sp.]